ncbi:MAG: GNAT family N-acetyltransferase [Eubacterium sp.]|nr:GNAT family N-acetyltransferase [Eubacterium sp.]
MRIEEEIITLKDGRNLILRSAEDKDAPTMLDYIMKTAEETHFLIRYPEEISLDIEREKMIINDVLESEDSVWFTVFDGEKAIGNCSISRHRNYIKYRHRCDFAIAIEQAYCGQGLGTILMIKSINKAKELGFEQIELGVYEDNENGLALYRRMGFQEMGRNLRAFKLKDGTYIDEIIMILFL